MVGFLCTLLWNKQYDYFDLSNLLHGSLGNSTRSFGRIDAVSIQKPTFSIITAVYNCEEFIRETVVSVLNFAPAEDFEYLIIDDGSFDKTSEILQEFESKVKIFRQTNSGEAAAVNLGLRKSIGSYAVVVSADDPLVSSELFSRSKMILDSNPKIMATYPDWYLINAFSEIEREITTQDFSIEALVGLNKCLPGPGAVFRIKEAVELGGRNDRLKFGSDFDFWLRLSDLGSFQRIPHLLAQWRSHQNSTSIKLRGLEMSKERIQIIEEYLACSDHNKKIERMALGNAYYSAAILRYFSQDVPHRRYLLKAVISRKGLPENMRLRELIYLLTIPVSEFVWLKIKRARGAASESSL